MSDFLSNELKNCDIKEGDSFAIAQSKITKNELLEVFEKYLIQIDYKSYELYRESKATSRIINSDEEQLKEFFILIQSNLVKNKELDTKKIGLIINSIHNLITLLFNEVPKSNNLAYVLLGNQLKNIHEQR
jgi:hypothetical protein